MAEITRKRNGELSRGIFQILSEAPDGLPAREVLLKLENIVKPTDFEKSDYPNNPGVRRFEKIARFATIGCVKAGWLVKSKGKWILTDIGKIAYKNNIDPENFYKESSRLYRKWADDNNENDKSEGIEALDNSKISFSFESADEQAWFEIEKYIQQIDPYDFQNKVVPCLLRSMGYYVVFTAPPGADGGIDIIAHPDPLGTKEPTIKVSVRRRSQKADVKDLREFMSRLHQNDVGIFISVSGFTSEAERECRSDQRKIRLIDLEKFFELWTEHYRNIHDSERKFLPIRPVWFLALDGT